MTIAELKKQLDDVSISLENKARDTLSLYPEDSETRKALAMVYEDIGREIGTLASIIFEYEKEKN